MPEINGYEFNEKKLLINALTHSSFCNEHDLPYPANNQRLEFLGDAVLDTVIGEELYKMLPEYEEGRLSKIRSAVVREQTLEAVSISLGLGEMLYLGRGEENSGMRMQRSALADALEAVIGAIFLDGGWDEAKHFVLDQFKVIISDTVSGRPKVSDSKSMLQELLQAIGKYDFGYEIDHEEGPEHKKAFFVNFICDGEIISSGSGPSKKEAEQNAALEAIQLFKPSKP